MNKYNVHIDDTSYKSKPKDVWAISLNIAKKVVSRTPEQIADTVGSKGHTVVLSVIEEGKPRQQRYMDSQQMLMLDFDSGETTIQDMLDDAFIQENASFIYKTFSHTEEHQRFRVAFFLDEPLVNNHEVHSAYAYLFELYPSADKVNRDSSRLFFGGTESIEVEYDNILEKASIPIMAEVEKHEVKSTAGKLTVVDDRAYEYSIPTWMLIEEGQKEEVARRWRKYGEGKSFLDNTHAFDFFRALDMAELLGLPYNPFIDILEYEENPSCGIHKLPGKNTYLYTQQNRVGKTGGKMSYDIIQIVSKLAGITYIGALQYLAETTGINYNVSDEVAQISSEVAVMKKILLSETLKEEHEGLYKIFGVHGRNTRVNAILDILTGQLYSDNGEIKVVSWISSENIAKRIGTNRKAVDRLLAMMAHTGMVMRFKDDDVPGDILETIEQNRNSYLDDDGEWKKRTTPRKYRSHVYTIKPGANDHLKVDENSEELHDAGYTTRGYSREWLLRVFGEEKADEVFPQDIGRKVSKESREITTYIRQRVMDEIMENGYVIINEIRKEIEEELKLKTKLRYKWDQQESELIDGYGLEKKSLTNEMKEEYDITHLPTNSRPFALVIAQ